MNFEFEKEKSTISNLDEIVKIGFFLIFSNIIPLLVYCFVYYSAKSSFPTILKFKDSPI